MTWAEFNLRLFSYNRIKEAERKDLREVAWSNFLASFHSDPKRFPKTKQEFWAIGKDQQKRGVSSAAKEAFLKATQQYNKEVNGKIKS
tara:strand:+ start:1832 stop:2095 length:264 start_codon:yes stop_codon:yes gene_type:complete